MIGRIARWIGLVVAMAAISLLSPARAAGPERIVAVGDLHGDYQAWLDIARAARLVDRRNRWAGGASTLVQTGDIVDRGPDSLKIIRHLMRLKREAARRGGQVVVLVGNHEAMNMTDDLRYVHPGEYAAFATPGSDRLRELTYQANEAAIVASYRARSPQMTSAAIRAAWLAQNPPGKLEHRAAWSPRGELGRWTIGNPAVARLGGTVFVHGGISARYAGIGLDEINRRTAAALASATEAPDSIINDPFGPLWYRGLVTGARDPETGAQGAAAPPPAAAPLPTAEQELASVLAAHGARRMVIGHTPSLKGIEISNGGRLVRIDTGNSSYYGGRLSFLEIIGERLVAHSVQRSPPARR